MTYVYNAVNRIVSMSQAPTLTNYTYLATGGISVENANGALLTNVLDNENRLLNTQFSNNTISTYTYSGDGLRRTSNEQGGGLTSIIWDGTNALMDLS
jgi:hypothetical protein